MTYAEREAYTRNKKIAKNIKEFKRGKFKSIKQAIAVAYAQAREHMKLVKQKKRRERRKKIKKERQ